MKGFLHTIKIASTVNITQQGNLHANKKHHSKIPQFIFDALEQFFDTHYSEPGFTLENATYPNIIEYLKSGKDILFFILFKFLIEAVG